MQDDLERDKNSSKNEVKQLTDKVSTLYELCLSLLHYLVEIVKMHILSAG